MFRRTLILVSAAVLCSAVPAMPSASAFAQDEPADRCPAGGSGCTIDNALERIRDRVVEGAQAVLDDENPEGRVQEVRDTLEDCMECGMDAIDNALDDFDTGDSSDSSDSSSSSSDSGSDETVASDDSGDPGQN